MKYLIYQIGHKKPFYDCGSLQKVERKTKTMDNFYVTNPNGEIIMAKVKV